MELCPECIVVECEPTGFPRAPVGKKRVWIDVRNMSYVAAHSYDRRGELWRSFDTGYSQFEKGTHSIKVGNVPEWSWMWVQCCDIQTRRMSLLHHVKEIPGVATAWNVEGMYENYLTEQAIARLGA